MSVVSSRPLWYMKNSLLGIELSGNTSQTGTPTPDAPQPIHTVSGDNEIIISGKNVFDISDCSSLLIYNGTSQSFNNGVVTITKTSKSGLGGAYIPLSVTGKKYASLLNHQ